MTPDRALAIVLSYFLVASISWTYGYLCRVWIERRTSEGEALWAELHIDLAGQPYDWQIDGECVRETAR